jgi:hypothetical protein
LAPPVVTVPAALSNARSQEKVPAPVRLQTAWLGVTPLAITLFRMPLVSAGGAVSARSAMRRPKLAAPALWWRGRHSAICVLHEGSDGVQAAAGRPTLPPEHRPPPPLDDEDDAEAPPPEEEDPLVDAVPPEPPVPPDVAVEVSPADDDVAEVEPPLPVLTADEQLARTRVGSASVTRRAKEDEVVIPGA